MRLVDFARVVATVAALVAAVVLSARRRIFRRFQAFGATAPDAAQPVGGTGLTGFWRRKLLAAGVLRAATGGRYWLHVDTWRAYQRRRRRRALIVVTVVGAMALATVTYITWLASRGPCC